MVFCIGLIRPTVVARENRNNKLKLKNKLFCVNLFVFNIFSHEYLGMQSKYSTLETRSKELISQQGGAVSGASMALAGLGSRLDQLVEQLIASYSISEQELEVSGMRTPYRFIANNFHVNIVWSKFIC